MEHTPLEAVYIFFDTATYDEIARDVKVGLRDIRFWIFWVWTLGVEP